MATSLARRLRDPTAWSITVDVFAILVAISLPWSTSLVAIFAVALLLTRISFLDLGAFLQVVRRPICLAPLALVLLACVGTLWSDADWATRLHAINPTVKLLMLPVLFYHFERSERGLWVLVAFLISCLLLTVMSWIVLFHPELSFRQIDPEPGIFVKNYIDQSQEFTLCAVALAYPIITMVRAQKPWSALFLSAIVLGFFLTMAFVVVSRTALVTMPIMIVVFGMLHLSRRTTAIILCAAAFFGAFAWAKSPQLQSTLAKFSRDYELYAQHGTSTSIGERLEYWKKSLRFYAEAPTVGHGTGSTRGLFEHVATGPASSASAQVIGNPHNQTLNVAVQWGSLGVVVLYSIWIVHLLLFRGAGFANWIGLLVVVQNIFTSLFNSHLFDFHEGWMYVVGVGVAGGMVLKTRPLEPVSMPIDSRSAAS
jgi:O-antigen ligase